MLFSFSTQFQLRKTFSLSGMMRRHGIPQFAIILGLMGIGRQCSARADGCPVLTSIVCREDDVLATTDDGMYRLERSNGQWSRLKLPAAIPSGGLLAAEPDGSSDVYYFHDDADPGNPLPAGKTPGIFRLTKGTDWSLVQRAQNISDLCVLRDGSIYAVLGLQIEQSTDRGKTWRDITPQVYAKHYVARITPDRTNPALIEVTIDDGLRGCTIRSKDDKYSWATAPIDSLASYAPDAFLAPRAEIGSLRSGMVKATLCNYLKRSFGHNIQIPAVELETTKSDYSFKSDAPKNVTVELRFNPEDNSAMTLYDATQPTICWGLKAILPDGHQVVTDTGRADPNAPLPLHPIPHVTTFSVDHARPYRRTINLDDIYDLRAPGSYRLELFYENDSNNFDTSSAWIGMLDSAAFRVTVTAEGAKKD